MFRRKHRYFVSYQTQVDAQIGIGNTTLTRSKKIKTDEDLIEVAHAIAVSLSKQFIENATEETPLPLVAIMNFIKL